MENTLNHKDVAAAIQTWHLPQIKQVAQPAELASLDFTVPDELEASQPPEARGLRRDQVRLMVSSLSNDQVIHTRFQKIGELLGPLSKRTVG